MKQFLKGQKFATYLQRFLKEGTGAYLRGAMGHGHPLGRQHNIISVE